MVMGKYKNGKPFSGIIATQGKSKGYLLPDGYRYRCVNGKKNVAEHRFIMEEFLGRKLFKTEIIHHINGIKTDNRLENLLIMNRKNHGQIYRSLLMELAKYEAENKFLNFILEIFLRR